MRKYVIFGFAYYSLFNLGLRAIGATIDCVKYYYIEKPKYKKVMKGKSVQYILLLILIINNNEYYLNFNKRYQID